MSERFHAGEVSLHLDMEHIGELCVSISLPAYKELLEEFLGTSPASLEDLLQSLDRGDVTQLIEPAHIFKGTCANLGLTALTRIASTIQRDAAAFEAAQCARTATELRWHWRRAQALCLRMGLIDKSNMQ